MSPGCCSKRGEWGDHAGCRSKRVATSTGQPGRVRGRSHEQLVLGWVQGRGRVGCAAACTPGQTWCVGGCPLDLCAG